MPEGFDPAVWTRPPSGRRDRPHVDLVLATLADLQHGVVSCRQMLKLGVTHRQLERRLSSGHLHRRFPGVYVVGRRKPSDTGRRMAAFLASGEGARLAGWAGATQRKLLAEGNSRIDVAIPSKRRITVPGVTVTRSIVHVDEVTVVDGIPTHSVARILLDLARRRDGGTAMERAWRRAIFRGTLDVGAISTLLGRHHGEPGTPALRALYDRRTALAGIVQNEFESLMLAIIRDAGLPEPLCNVPYEVAPGLMLRPDFRIPQLDLVIESDGRDGHDDVEFLCTDDERDAYYRALGNIVIRTTYWQAKRERQRIVERLEDHQARHRRR